MNTKTYHDSRWTSSVTLNCAITKYEYIRIQVTSVIYFWELHLQTTDKKCLIKFSDMKLHVPSNYK
jgi:hypothetical protein